MSSVITLPVVRVERWDDERRVLPYLYRWDRQGRKGQPCNMLARGKMNSCLVEFADGYQMVTSRNAIRRNKSAVLVTSSTLA